jgi:septum site-determining protein MinC
LYLRQTLRSGQAISHKGQLVIIGDVNPGAEVMAEGDITVWGALRGIAHAGIGGNTRAEIRALRLQPVQLRIAHAIARAPDRPRKNFSTHSGPETARIVNGTIRITASNPD